MGTHTTANTDPRYEIMKDRLLCTVLCLASAISPRPCAGFFHFHHVLSALKKANGTAHIKAHVLAFVPRHVLVFLFNQLYLTVFFLPACPPPWSSFPLPTPISSASMQYAGSWYDGEGYSGQQQQQYGPTPDAGIVPFPNPSSYDTPSVIQPSISQQQGHHPPRTSTIYTSGSRRRASSNSSKPIRSAQQGPNRARAASVNRSVLRKRRQSGGAETRPRNSIARSRTNTSSRTDPGTRPSRISFL